MLSPVKRAAGPGADPVAQQPLHCTAHRQELFGEMGVKTTLVVKRYGSVPGELSLVVGVVHMFGW